MERVVERIAWKSPGFGCGDHQVTVKVHRHRAMIPMFPLCPVMVELGTDPAAGDGIRPWVTTRSMTRLVAIFVAVAATALWMSVVWATGTSTAGLVSGR